MNYTRLARKSGVAAAVLAALLLVGWGPASAHQTFIQKTDVKGIDGALALPRADVASSIYGTLAASGDVNFIKLDVKAPLDVKVDLFVPHTKKFGNFYPSYALLGPGLPTPEGVLPFKLPMGDGAIVITGTPKTPRPSAVDYTLGTRLYAGIPELSRHVETPGTYYIAVWAPGCNFGDYVVVLGGPRDWSLHTVYNSYRKVVTARNEGWGTVRGDKCAVSELEPAIEETKVEPRCELTVAPGTVTATGLNFRDRASLNMFGVKCG